MKKHEETLEIISRAWGRQSGYCFFPWISGKAKDKYERTLGYNEGKAFKWPKQKDDILAHMAAHEDDDLYWCPSLFEYPQRRIENAMDEHALWADLDKVKPKDIKDYPPTIAWETSPGRYQALWIVMGYILGASWPGRENQCLTYHLDADLGGWDTTQLLRIPGWKNHKPEYVQQYGEAPRGKLLWAGGRTYLPDDFTELPPVPALSVVSEMVEHDVEKVDRHAVWDQKIKLKVPKRIRDFLTAKETSGDRSTVLWQIERELADAGCTFAEIIAIVQHSVWNKYVGRADEFKRLSTEVARALAERTDDTMRKIEVFEDDEEARLQKPMYIDDFVAGIKPPRWLVENIISQGACGFIAGEPKSYKSWVSLDLGLSVATGVPFLDHFRVMDPGMVLWIQEEDPAPLIKQRYDKVLPAKLADKIISVEGEIFWAPAQEKIDKIQLKINAGRRFTISDGAWLHWFDEVLEEDEYKLCILDPLMMMAGDVEENRAQQMTEKIFKPLKQLSRKHNTAIMVIHHLRKSDPKYQQRGGQLMLGSMANHAWSEDSLYLKRVKRGDIQVEQESKSSTSRGFKITNLNNTRWEPQVIVEKEKETPVDDIKRVRQHVRQAKEPRQRKGRASRALSALLELGPGAHSTRAVADKAGISQSAVMQSLERAATKDLVDKVGTQWQLK